MQKQQVFLAGLLATVMIVGFGCAADPAADKPAAEVSAALPETAPASDGVELTFGAASTITWVGSKVTGKHDGGFQDFGGSVRLVGNDPTASSVTVSIDMHSLWSDTDDLTVHLKSPEFFGVESFPTATFSSTSIEAAETGFMVTGNLDLHGVSKSIRFPAEITIADGSVTVRASFAIKRFDFAVVYPGRKDDLIRDDVAITLDLTAALPMEEAATEAAH